MFVSLLLLEDNLFLICLHINIFKVHNYEYSLLRSKLTKKQIWSRSDKVYKTLTNINNIISLVQVKLKLFGT